MIWMFLSCIGSVKETGELPPWIDIPSYRQADLSTDMFPTHQPEEVACPANGFRVEVNQLEIQTDICNYAVVEWVTQHDVPAKTTLEALVLHTGLWALEEGNAHFALSIDGELFWEESPSIPSDTEFFFYEIEWPTAIPAGTIVQLHLHNHGANDWKLGYFQPAE